MRFTEEVTTLDKGQLVAVKGVDDLATPTVYDIHSIGFHCLYVCQHATVLFCIFYSSLEQIKLFLLFLPVLRSYRLLTLFYQTYHLLSLLTVLLFQLLLLQFFLLFLFSIHHYISELT